MVGELTECGAAELASSLIAMPAHVIPSRAQPAAARVFHPCLTRLTERRSHAV